MTGREFQKLARKYLIAQLPGFVVKGRLLLASPIQYLLRGYSCEPSAFDRAKFCVQVFVQPLFVPTDNIAFVIGDRLGSIKGRHDKWWNYSNEDEAGVMHDVFAHIQREGHVILDKFKTLEDFVKNAITRHTNPYSPYPAEMVAYGAILIGDGKKACRMFDRLENTLRTAKHHRDYHDEILARAHRVRAAFERDRSEAIAILNRWRDETVAALKLTKFVEPLPGHSGPDGMA